MKILPKEKILDAITQLINQTKSNIKISSAWIKGEILKSLLENIPKNIDVEIIIRASSVDDLLITDEKVFKLAKKHNFKIFLNHNLHSKFFIFDDKKAIVGSSNLTNAGLLEDGNIETDVLIEEDKNIKILLEYFHSIKEKSISIDDITGFILNSESSKVSNLLLLDEKLSENSFLFFKKENGTVIGRISNIKTIPVKSFYPVDNILVKPLLQDTEKFQKIFTQKNENWEKSVLFGYFNENADNLKIAEIELIGIYNENLPEEESKLQPSITPLETGIIGFKSYKLLSKIMKINHAGYNMAMPVKFGEVLNTENDAYVDIDKIAFMHMAVVGTTGSGKTTFVRRLLENLNYNTKVFIFDLYNEYSKYLKNAYKVDIPSTIFPITYENIRELLKNYGVVFQEKSKEEKEVAGVFKRNLKPDLDFIGFKEKDLEDLIYEGSKTVKEDLILKTELIYFLEILQSDYGKEVITNQKEIVVLLKNSLKRKENFIIFNFSLINDLTSKLNLAGLLLKQIFKISQKEKGKYLIVLEEAQNFAPEKSATEIPATSENLAYIMSKKIAMEGRKFNLGLIAITQRPASISKFVLSQLNTQVILKLVNKNDLDAVSIFFETSKQQVFNSLPYLKPGYLYITGLAVPFGYLAKIKLG